MRNKNIRTLAECGVMVALAFALSCIKLFPMPLGGSVTLASMLPIMFISVKYGSLIGIGTGFVYSLAQLAQALIEGDVFPYCEGIGMLMICLFFDYLIPFTALGLAGIFKELGTIKNKKSACYVGFGLAVAIRFICHFITGAAIWGQWAPDGMGKYFYSFAYNGAYLGVDLIICLAVATIILHHKEIRKIIGV